MIFKTTKKARYSLNGIPVWNSYEWHDEFCWFPTRLSCDSTKEIVWAWLRNIEVRYDYLDGFIMYWRLKK